MGHAAYGLRSLAQTIYIATTDSLINAPGLSGFVQSESTDPFALPSTETAVLESLLGQVEIYLVWYLALLVIGLMAVMQLKAQSVGAGHYRLGYLPAVPLAGHCCF